MVSAILSEIVADMTIVFLLATARMVPVILSETVVGMAIIFVPATARMIPAILPETLADMTIGYMYQLLQDGLSNSVRHKIAVRTQKTQKYLFEHLTGYKLSFIL